MSDAMQLLMAQVDGAPGELIGEFIERAAAVRAKKRAGDPEHHEKCRPGYVIYVDAPESLETEMAALFGGELGTWGYRMITAEHKHFEIDRFTVQPTVCTQGVGRVFEVRAKRISQAGAFSRVEAEHDDLSAICASLRESGAMGPLSEFETVVEIALRSDHEATAIIVSI